MVRNSTLPGSDDGGFIPTFQVYFGKKYRRKNTQKDTRQCHKTQQENKAQHKTRRNKNKTKTITKWKQQQQQQYKIKTQHNKTKQDKTK